MGFWGIPCCASPRCVLRDAHPNIIVFAIDTIDPKKYPIKYVHNISPLNPLASPNQQNIVIHDSYDEDVLLGGSHWMYPLFCTQYINF